MIERVKPVSSTFEKIREGLDPAYSYVVFEKTAGSREDAELREVVRTLKRLKLSVRRTRIFHDDATGKLLLMVRFDPGRADEIMQEIVSIGLPEDVTFYAYGSHVAE